MSDLESLQPESLQAIAQDAALNAQARQAAAEEAQQEHESFLDEQAESFIAERVTEFDGAAREWATDAQGVIADLNTLTQQGSVGLLTADEMRQQFDRLNGEVAHLRRQREDLVRQIDTLEEWETSPRENIARLLPPTMRRPM